MSNLSKSIIFCLLMMQSADAGNGEGASQSAGQEGGEVFAPMMRKSNSDLLPRPRTRPKCLSIQLPPYPERPLTPNSSPVSEGESSGSEGDSVKAERSTTSVWDRDLSLEIRFGVSDVAPHPHVSSQEEAGEPLQDLRFPYTFYEQRADYFWNCMQRHNTYRAVHPVSVFGNSRQQRRSSLLGAAISTVPLETSSLGNFLQNCMNDQFVEENFTTHLSLAWLANPGRDDSMPGLDAGKRIFLELVEEHVASRERVFLGSYHGEFFDWEADWQLIQVDADTYAARVREAGETLNILCIQWKKEEIMALATAACQRAVSTFSVSFVHPPVWGSSSSHQ